MGLQQSLMSQTVQLSLAQGEALLVQAFTAHGVPSIAAQSVSKALISAEAEGQAGHGFSRVADYIGQVRTGKIIADAVPQTEKTAPCALRTDAGHGFAYPALDQAIEQGAVLADDMGLASVAIAHSHHCGALSVHVRRIAEQGFLALMMANAPAAIAPWGASTPLYGTNPIAFAAPRVGGDPLIIDLSLSRVARGKIMHAHKTDQAIPLGWALAPDGTPTTDPAEGLSGTMVPIGQAKGTSLALMVEILAALMTGSSASKDVSSFFTADGPPPDVGQYVMIVKPPADIDFASRLESLLLIIEEMDGARVPGRQRADRVRQAHVEGLKVPKSYIDGIEKLIQEGRGNP